MVARRGRGVRGRATHALFSCGLALMGCRVAACAATSGLHFPEVKGFTAHIHKSTPRTAGRGATSRRGQLVVQALDVAPDQPLVEQVVYAAV